MLDAQRQPSQQVRGDVVGDAVGDQLAFDEIVGQRRRAQCHQRQLACLRRRTRLRRVSGDGRRIP